MGVINPLWKISNLKELCRGILAEIQNYLEIEGNLKVL